MAWEGGCRGDDGMDYYRWGCGQERCTGEQWSGMLEQVSPLKVMTDEQIEILRRQISIYTVICEQLVEMHRAFTARQESLVEISMGSMHCRHPSGSTVASKSFTRHRWTPTAAQLQILEDIFRQGNGTPSKHDISDITSQLSKHGQVSDDKVYNWFQNRRARSKKKHGALRGCNAGSGCLS